jgi:cyanophycinase
LASCCRAVPPRPRLIKDHPELPGIGLSENTAIVVHGDRFEVIGAWKVAIHDNTRLYQPWEKPYYVLAAGDVYNMKTRRVEKLGIGAPAPAQESTTDAKTAGMKPH